MPIYKDVSSLEVVGYTVPEDGTFADGVNYILEKLDAIPEEDVEPVRHGHWVRREDVDGTFYLCSACGEELPYVCIEPSTVYQPYGMFENIDFTERCPTCGAKMDEEEQDET